MQLGRQATGAQGCLGDVPQVCRVGNTFRVKKQREDETQVEDTVSIRWRGLQTTPLKCPGFANMDSCFFQLWDDGLLTMQSSCAHIKNCMTFKLTPDDWPITQRTLSLFLFHGTVSDKSVNVDVFSDYLPLMNTPVIHTLAQLYQNFFLQFVA